LESDRAAPITPGRLTSAALLVFTSATTGNPKLIPLSCANLSAIALINSQTFPVDQSDRFLTMVPLFHSYGLNVVLTQLFCGGPVFCTPGFDPDRFLTWLEDFRPTWISGAPPVLHAILALAQRYPDSFRRVPLRSIQTFGAPVHPELVQSLERAVQAPVLQGYGLTEAGGIARSTPSAWKPGSVGRCTGSEIAITDESGAILPPDREGEIVVRGPTLMTGYLDDPEANRRAFRDGWFRTSDIGRLDSDGFLYITGRLNEIINRGGQKIIPLEVDRVLATHPSVADAAAFPIPHQTLGEDVAAAMRGEVLAQAAEVVRHVRRLTGLFQRRFGGRALRAVASVRTEVLASPQNPQQLTALALWEYVPRAFPAPIVQFLAAEETVSTYVLDDPRLGWRDFARGGLEVFTTPGGHATMLDARNTPAIAAKLEPLQRPRELDLSR
jgi:acyl-CoA synthetase (AMP-forming)/AMP-acid ligase II